MASVRILFVAMVISVCSLASGQDRIYFRDAAPVDASVREIGDDYVLYKAWDNLGGPDFRVSLMRVDRIVFENGTESVFMDGKPVSGPDALMFSGAVVPGRLDYRHGRYYLGVSVVTPEQMMDYIGYKNYGSTYLKARRQYMAGLYLTCIGGAFLLAGIVTHAASSAADSMFDDSGFGPSGGADAGLYVASYVLGAAGLASGIPLLVKGNRKLDAIADDYNRRNGYSLGQGHVEKSLTVGQCRSGGVGLAFNF